MRKGTAALVTDFEIWGLVMKRTLSAAALALLLSGIGTAAAAEMTTVHYFGQPEGAVTGSLPYGSNEAAGHYVTAGDVEIYYEVYGSGEPLLILHGGGLGCTFEMGRLIDALKDDYQVIAPSTRGHGRSGIGTAAITFQSKADDMLAAVNAVTTEPVTILGFSDGAYTAYAMAALYPDRVKKIVAIGAGENKPALRQIPSFTIEELTAMDPRFMQEKLALCPEPERLQDYLNEYYAFFNHELISKEFFAQVRCPVLLMAGELDPNAPLDTVINAWKMLPQAQLAIIPNAGHAAFMDNFAAVMACVEPFLAGQQ